MPQALLLRRGGWKNPTPQQHNLMFLFFIRGVQFLHLNLYIYIYIHNHLHEKLLRMFALVVSILATTTEVAQCSHLHISCSWLQACAAQSPDPTPEKYVSPMSPKHCFQKTNTCEIATKFDAFKIANTVLRTKCSQTHIEGTCPMPHVPETLLTQKENHCVYHIWSRPQFQRP